MLGTWSSDDCFPLLLLLLMTYTSRLFDAHKTVIESFIIEQDGLDAYKNLKFAPKLSEAKIKYAMLERMLEIVGAGVDIEAVTRSVEEDKVKRAQAFMKAAQVNHVPAAEMIVDEYVNELTDNGDVTDGADECSSTEIPSYQELEADLVGNL